jgi:hypothetical protein
MSPEWLSSKNTQELKDWVSYYEEELRQIRSEITRRLLNE